MMHQPDEFQLTVGGSVLQVLEPPMKDERTKPYKGLLLINICKCI